MNDARAKIWDAIHAWADGCTGHDENDTALAKAVDDAINDLVINSGAPEAKLAECLYETMEHLDPGIDPFVEWACLSEREQEFYRLLVRKMRQVDASTQLTP